MFTENLSEFFRTDDFAISATLTGGTVISVIFDHEFADFATQHTQIEGKNAAIACKTSDVSGLSHGSALTISGVSYKVVGIQPDLTGVITMLILENQA